MDSHYYCYITINKTNGKCYVGSHTHTDTFDKKYLGSGKILSNAIKRYGKENFVSAPLKYFKNRKESYSNEEKYILLFDTLEPNGYNISPNGGIMGPRFFSDKTKEEYKLQRKGKTLVEILGEEGARIRGEKIGKKKKGQHHTKEAKDKISKALIGKTYPPRTEEHKKHLSEASLNRKMSETAKEKMRKAKKGQIPWNKGIKQKDYKNGIKIF